MRNLKRRGRAFLSLILCITLLCSCLPLTSMAAGFTDVPSGAWYKDAVTELVERNIIKGTTETTFSPSAPLTRAAFVTMLAKTVLTADEVNQYKFEGGFSDVAADHWSNPYVNWASEAGIVNGYTDGTFRPNVAVSRQDMAVMVVNFSNAFVYKLPVVNAAIVFSDNDKIAKYAASSVALCQKAGIINGYSKDNTFRPKNSATRAEAASLYAGFLSKYTQRDFTVTRKRINNIAVRAVEFDPSLYTAGLTFGSNRVYGAESVTSLVNRTGAVIAVNAAFFDMSDYAPLGTIISGGEVMTVFDTYAPAKSAFTLDTEGNFSIQNFSTDYTASIAKADGTTSTLSKLAYNRRPDSDTDGTRIIFTKAWGSSLGFPARDAVVVDTQGVITAKYSESDVAIPAEGYVLAQRSRREYEGDFFDSCEVGMTIDLTREYKGITAEPVISIGAGPRIVKDGAVYGNTNTYIAEGFSSTSITTASAVRVCVGIKPDGSLVLLTARATLPQLANLMVKMGCKDAINFDGGGSSNIYVDGQWLYGPQSRLLNTMLYFK